MTYPEGVFCECIFTDGRSTYNGRCEQMGVGKTLMCLSLMVATLHTPPQPPDNTLDCSPAFTQHTLRTYPFPQHREARSRLDMSTLR